MALLLFFSTAMQAQDTVTTTGGTANFIPKFNSPKTIVNSQVFDNGSSVGIGTTSPLSKLHVNGEININGPVGDLTTAGYKIGGFYIARFLAGSRTNIAIGDSAGSLLLSGFNNTLVGHTAGNGGSPTSYVNNTFVGALAGLSAHNSANTYVGVQAGRFTSIGSSNVMMGINAGLNSQGSNNTFIGSQSALDIGGSFNTFVGMNTGTSVNSGAFNVLLGYGANIPAGTITNAIALGANTTVTASNTMILGDNNIKVGIGMNGGVPAEKLSVAGTIQSTTGGFKFPDNTVQTTAGVQQNSSATFSAVNINTFTGVTDRHILVDASGNLKVGDPVPQNICAGPWCINGNLGTSDATDFIGTRDFMDLVVKTNDTERMRITKAGNVGIGTSAPTTDPGVLLDVNGGLNNTFGRFGNTAGYTDIGFNGAHGIINSNQDLLINFYSGTNVGIGPGKLSASGDFESLKNVFLATQFPSVVTVASNTLATNLGGAIKLDVRGNGRFTSVTNDARFVEVGYNGTNATINFESDEADDALLLNYYSNRDVIVGSGTARLIGNGDIIGNAKVGIGLSTPSSPLEKLQIGNAFAFHDGASKAFFRNAYFNGSTDARLESGFANAIRYDNNGDMIFQASGTFPGPANGPITWINAFTIKTNGVVKFGTLEVDKLHVGSQKPTGVHSNAILTVSGKMVAQEFHVTKVMEWADFVFSVNYIRKNYLEREILLKKQRHLEGVKSEDEIIADGLDVAQTMKGLTMNIEELWLDVIDLYKTNKKLTDENTILSEQLKLLYERIEKLESLK